MNIRTIRFIDTERDCHLRMMSKRSTFRFAKKCPEGYELLAVQDGETSMCYSLANGQKLYFKGNNVV